MRFLRTAGEGVQGVAGGVCEGYGIFELCGLLVGSCGDGWRMGSDAPHDFSAAAMIAVGLEIG